MHESLEGDRQSAAHPPSASILLVEDDTGLAEEIVADLSGRGYALHHVADGLDALGELRDGRYDLLLVDRVLPGMNGIDLIRQLRRESLMLPVLVLSSLNAMDDKVLGLKAGGDDYLAKPFGFPELAARVEALLRRPPATRDTILRVGALRLDLIDRQAMRHGRMIELLPREFKLLEYLMRRPGQTVTRAMLLEDVWSYKFVPQTNLVDVHIGKLRRKVDAPGDPPMIQSVWGSGFVLREPD
jgi:two-component system OmpR family response regulator